MDLVIEIYALTRQLPKSETYGLSSQLQRSAVSIAANIAEGYGREGRREYLRFLSIANGSLKELETLLVVVRRVGLLPREETTRACVLAGSTGRLLRAIRRSLRKGHTTEPATLIPRPQTLDPRPQTRR